MTAVQVNCEEQLPAANPNVSDCRERRGGS